MNLRIELLAIAVSLGIGALVIELIRKKKLLERYALLWLASTVLLLVTSFWRELLAKIALLMGVYYAPSALFIIAFMCGMLLMLHFSTVISSLTQQNTVLSQEVALLNERIRSLETKINR